MSQCKPKLFLYHEEISRKCTYILVSLKRVLRYRRCCLEALIYADFDLYRAIRDFC